MPRSQALRLALLLAAGLGVLVPGVWGAIAVASGILLWLVLRPTRRELLLVLPLATAAVVLLITMVSSHEVEPEARLAKAGRSLGRLLSELDEAARQASEALPSPVADRAARQRAFASLHRLASDRAPVGASGGATTGVSNAESRTWILFDPDGEATAWAGRGLVHEIVAEALPSTGRVYVGSFTANSFLAIEPLGGDRRPWRVGVGVSLPNDRLPDEVGNPVQWSILEQDVLPEPGTAVVEVDSVRLAVRGLSTAVTGSRGTDVRRLWAALCIAVALLLAGLESRRTAGVSGNAGLAFSTLGAGLMLTLSWSLSVWLLAPLAAGVVLASVTRLPFQQSLGRGEAAFRVSAALALIAVIWGSSVLIGRSEAVIDLGRDLGGGALVIGVRMALFALAFGFLRAARRDIASDGELEPLRWGLMSALVLLVAAAAHGWPLPGLVLAAVGTIVAMVWARRGGWTEGKVGIAVGCVLAALVAAIVWELSYHQLVERRLRQFVDVELSPPTAVEMAEAAAMVDSYFESLAVEDLSSGDPMALDSQDLAFALWRKSPLALGGRLSMVSVGPEDAPLSTFAYGLPTGAEGEADDSSQLQYDLSLPGWEGATVEGRGLLTLGGGPWTVVEYRLVLRPGFREGGSLLPTLAEGLLRQQSDLVQLPPDLPGDLLLGLYESDGSVAVPPWKGAADLGDASVPPKVEIAGGRARTFVAGGDDGLRVLYLPIPSLLEGLERVATHAAGPLLILLFSSGLWFVVTLGESGRRAAVLSGWRSFSKRLVVLYTVLLIVPIVLINVLVLRVFSERLEREERAAGQAALESAQRILGDYVFSLEPGFGIDTAVGDDVLRWLSGVVHHEVNLYWGSRLSASSKRELFSSGLLPPRIPGDIFSRIALEGADLASRTTRAGGAVYEEFYAPLEIPGVRTEDAGLFVSTPLLAQEVATAQEMKTIRNRVLLAGGAVAVLLALLGRWVGRSFTRPLLQIVDGTQAIAAGAPSIEVEATDSEFVTLVEAIDKMAGRIAAARSELLREKQMVDRMIDNITSGVVSVDRSGHILLLNRTAHELLGAKIGEPIVGALDRDTRLRPVAEFVGSVGQSLQQKTVKLARGGGEETELTLVWVPLAGTGEPAALFVLEDVTEVLRGQRLQAWAEMARMIAHEVKNPLTPIRLSTEHLREVRRSRGDDLDEVLERCTNNILKQVDELQQIASDFSAYSRIPEIDPQPGDVADLVETVVDGYRAGGPSVSFERSSGPWFAVVDGKLLGRAVRNLLENAVRATQNGGKVRVVVEGGESRIRIFVSDSGPGIAAEHLPRIFEPYFSTEASGTGLGLPIARRIVEEHGGEIAAHNVSPHGLEVIITLPRTSGENDAGS